ncbi:hypothetical protein OHA37_21720 [Streptomyces sp. NBC_00335]|uniref:hypothetical protein n=1 Tax=unclassified Streptomyces TaxID=2593676 RepID=UPI002254BE92|nr:MULTISPECIES: hypothetical protein [unclassified Streptomyces]MCX5406481.1 hypothetical protein [Streptomyces sp. NBC_00086]
MKKRVSAVLTAAMAVGAVWAVPTVAEAYDTYPDISAGSWDERVRVYTQDWDPQVPRGLKAHVRKKGSPTRLATLTSFTRLPDAPCSLGEWCGSEPPPPSNFESEPVKLPELGVYTIDLEYTGSEGETVVHEDSGDLNYQVRPVISNLKSSAVSVENLDTVLSGDLVVYNPADGSSKPYAGGAFTAKRGSETIARTADAKGHFEEKFRITHTDFIQAPIESQMKFQLATQLNGRGDNEGVTVPVAPVETDMALDSPTLTGAYGTLGRVSGTATWKSADGKRKPLPVKMPIGLAYAASGLTDAAGRFNFSNQFRSDGVLNVWPHSVWFSSKTTVKVDATAGAFFHSFAAEVRPDKTVHVSSPFWRGEMPAGTTSLKVDVEYSADGKTGWTSRKAFNVATKPGTNPSYQITQSLPYPGAGYVRLRYAGTSAIHGAVTPAVRIERTMTAIPEFNVNPEPAKKGKPLTITGKLNHANPTWNPFGGQTVRYYFRPTGSTVWTEMGWSTTAADGTFDKSFTATRTGSWSARYVNTDPRHFAATSRVDDVIVNP